MRISGRFTSVAYVTGMTAAVLVIAWTERTNWSRVLEIRRNAEGVTSSRFHYAVRIEARMRKLNSMFFRYSLGLLAGKRAEIEAEGRSFQENLTSRKSELATPGEREIADQIEQLAAKYLEQSSMIFHTNYAPGALDAWREQRDATANKILAFCEQLGDAEQSALAAYLADSQADISVLQRSMIISSVTLLGMGGLLAFLIYFGFIGPLSESLRRSTSVIQSQEKLSSLGMLAAGVAHEIRNPLTSIKARLFTQQAVLSRASEAWEDNVFIADEISRLEKIVNDFLAFARPSEPEFRTFRIIQPIEELTDLFRTELTKRQIELKQDFASPALIKADPQQLKQVLINLIKNAAESIEEHGTITLRTYTQVRHRLAHSRMVAVLEVADTGKGIPFDVQKRLFDPFFTTKPGGTGLGLSTAARLLEKHGAGLEYETKLNYGTTFRIVLPAA